MPNILNDAFLNNLSYLSSDEDSEKQKKNKFISTNEKLRQYILPKKSKMEYDKKKDKNLNE